MVHSVGEDRLVQLNTEVGFDALLEFGEMQPLDSGDETSTR